MSPQQLATSQSARFALVTSVAYTHGQIVDAELANQSDDVLPFPLEEKEAHPGHCFLRAKQGHV